MSITGWHVAVENTENLVDIGAQRAVFYENQVFFKVFELPLPSFNLNGMASNRAFEIAFVGLRPGPHSFTYHVGEEFFLEKGVDFSNPQVQITLHLEKNTGFLQLLFEIGGSLDISCDRCGNALTMELWDEFKTIVKLVDDPELMNQQEEDPDVLYISRTESHLNVENWLYEFTLLSIPMQRMCSPEKMGGPQCNQDVLNKLKEMEVRLQQQTKSNIWKDLDQFKNNQQTDN